MNVSWREYLPRALGALLLGTALALTGCTGSDGNDGSAGQNAYELAVDNGFTGTEQEWLDQQKGQDGTDGKNGTDGADGTDGIDGIDGTDGSDGADGTNGINATVSIETLAALGLVYAGDITAINPVLDLSQTVAYDAGTGAVTVHFLLQDENGDGIDITAIPYELRVIASELIPTAEKADPTDNPGPAWNQLFSESGTPATSGVSGTLTLINAATGEYTYLCSHTLPATTHVIRVTVRTRFRFRDLNNQYVVVANPVNASYDFLESAPGTRLASSGDDMVSTSACESCHGARIGNVGHGGGYTQVKTCNHCHNVNYMATREPEAELAHMIHTIHSGGTIAGLGAWDDVEFPQPLYNCGKCHDGPDAAETYEHPSRFNCGPCHSDVNFATGVNHLGGAQATDAGCHACHPGAVIQGYHNPATRASLTDPKNIPEFTVTLGIDPPDPVIGYYQAGDTPLVTVTLSPAVDYTLAKDAAGDTDGNLAVASLSVYGPRNEAVPVLAPYTATDTTYTVANLLSLVDDMGEPAFDGPIQAHNLFIGSQIPDPDPVVAAGVDGFYGTGDDVLVNDPQVETDAGGFKYRLTIPAGMEPGTYLIRVRIGDYGRVGTGNYQIESTARIPIQIGTATVEPKVSGDACAEACHGTGTAPFHDERHAVYFDTDECLACHDKSGNHGDYIGNRVHAVHRASVTGDYSDRDWFEIAFPRPANNCTTCHTSALETPVWREPYMLACGGCHGVMSGADPNDPSYYQEENAELAALDPMSPTYDTDKAEIEAEIAAKEDQVRTEVAAAQHMEQNGGDADVDAAGGPHTLQCLVCHGENRVADTFVTHELIKFRPLPVDPND